MLFNINFFSGDVLGVSKNLTYSNEKNKYEAKDSGSAIENCGIYNFFQVYLLFNNFSDQSADKSKEIHNEAEENTMETHRTTKEENPATEETSYLKTMSNDNDYECDCQPVKPIFLPKIKPISPRENFNLTEILGKEIPKFHTPRPDYSEEKPFNSYHCESIIDNSSDKTLSDSQFKVIKSQIIDKLGSQRNSSFFNEKSLNNSPNMGDFHSRPSEISNDNKIENLKRSQKNSKYEINSENNEYFSPITENNNNKINKNSDDFDNSNFLDISSKEVINLMGLNEFSAEEVVDAIFSNESLRKITFPIFKIKLQVIFKYLKKISQL